MPLISFWKRPKCNGWEKRGWLRVECHTGQKGGSREWGMGIPFGTVNQTGSWWPGVARNWPWLRGCLAVLSCPLTCLLPSFLPPRTSGLVKPVSCFSHVATASPLLPTSTPARPLLPFSTGPGSPLFQSPAFQSQGSPLRGPELSLASVHVPLESIKPSKC